MRITTHNTIPDPAFPDSLNYGIVLIPDMSGFTRFVHETDMILGKEITCKLLNEIVETNCLGLSLAEIEGDAILFYRFGQPPSIREVLLQYEKMNSAFSKKIREISEHIGHPIDLSLKMIAHYGPIAQYSIGGFRKLYGETIVVAHRLLKNSIPAHAYVLCTEELLKAAGFELDAKSGKLPASNCCELYSELDDVCYAWFDYERRKLMRQRNQTA